MVAFWQPRLIARRQRETKAANFGWRPCLSGGPCGLDLRVASHLDGPARAACRADHGSRNAVHDGAQIEDDFDQAKQGVVQHL